MQYVMMIHVELLHPCLLANRNETACEINLTCQLQIGYQTVHCIVVANKAMLALQPDSMGRAQQPFVASK
jgi:hypothetical protein